MRVWTTRTREDGAVEIHWKKVCALCGKELEADALLCRRCMSDVCEADERYLEEMDS